MGRDSASRGDLASGRRLLVCHVFLLALDLAFCRSLPCLLPPSIHALSVAIYAFHAPWPLHRPLFFSDKHAPAQSASRYDCVRTPHSVLRHFRHIFLKTVTVGHTPSCRVRSDRERIGVIGHLEL